MIASIPSPEQAVWHLGPIPLRAYALCILVGIVVAIVVTRRRLAAWGHDPDVAYDVATWAVPFGIVGGRLYHVISSPQAYFGEGGKPLDAFKIWEGGLGIWGAVALGAVGVWLACRKTTVSFGVLVDAIAPGLALAQACGRWGNWFNNELYGAPTDLPWALQIHRWNPSTGRAAVDAQGNAIVEGYFHPTFLYESLWCLALAAFLLWAPQRWRTQPGQTMALYIMGYTLGRVWIEMLRVDTAHHVLGLRLNVWTSIVVFGIGAWWWWRARSTAETVEEGASQALSSGTASRDLVAVDELGEAAPTSESEGDASASGREFTEK